jgi:hypothetical protein
MKRILIIVGILIAAVAVVTVGIFLRGNGTPPVGPSGNLPPGATLPIATNNGTGNPGGDGGTGDTPDNNLPNNNGNLPIAGISAVAQAAVIDYAINSQGVVFIASNGAVILASSTETVGQANFGNILSAQFSPNGKWLLVEAGNKDAATWNLLDVAKKTWKSIQANTSEMAWSQNSSQLAYLGRRTNGNTLNTYTPATGAIKTLLTLSAPDLKIVWKDASHILIMDRPSSLVSGSVWEFGTTAGTLTQFVTNTLGVDLLWGGVKSGGLLFKAGPTGGTLSVINSSGSALQGMSFLTLPSKCVFGESAATSTIQDIKDYLFCSIPQDQQAIKERQLPDDYFKGKFGTSDALYAINLLRGTVAPVVSASENFNFDGANLKVYGENAYFVNRNDRKLYRVSLSGLSAVGPAVGE